MTPRIGSRSDRQSGSSRSSTLEARARWPLWFAMLSAIWGSSFLFIKVADEVLAPVQVALGRVVFGLFAVGVILLVRRERLPSGVHTWGHLAVAAVLLNVAPFTLFAYGETHVSSVLAGIFNAATPLFVVPVAVLMLRDERLTTVRMIGIGAGFAGVVTVFGIWRGIGSAGLEGDLLCLSAAACYGVGFPYARRFLSARADPLPLAAGQLLCGTIELAIVAPLISGVPGTIPFRVMGAVVVLGVFGTGIAYVLNFSLIRAAGATVASTVTYVVPVVSTLAGVLLLREPLTWNEPVGAAIILLAALAAQGRLAATRPIRSSSPPRPHSKSQRRSVAVDPTATTSADGSRSVTAEVLGAE
jgi:drug/metabolite transporter (DMT)-like permease